MTLGARLDRWTAPQRGRGRLAPQPSAQRWLPVSASLWARRFAELESRFAALPAPHDSGGLPR